MENKTPFWFVWNPDRCRPTVKHESLSSAQREAERLARSNPGQTFIVLVSVESYTVDNLVVVDLAPKFEDEIQF